MKKVGRPCSFCTSPMREEIEARIITGKLTQGEAANKLGQSRQSVNNHVQKHVTLSLREALEHLGLEPLPPLPAPDPVDVSLEAGLNVYKTLTNISQVSNELLKRALAEQDTKLTLLVMDRIESQLTLAAKLQGLFTDGPMQQVNILVADQWGELKSMIMTTLESFPEAREAVAQRLAREAGSGQVVLA